MLKKPNLVFPFGKTEVTRIKSLRCHPRYQYKMVSGPWNMLRQTDYNKQVTINKLSNNRIIKVHIIGCISKNGTHTTCVHNCDNIHVNSDIIYHGRNENKMVSVPWRRLRQTQVTLSNNRIMKAQILDCI